MHQLELSQEEVTVSEESNLVEHEDLVPGKWYRFVPLPVRRVQLAVNARTKGGYSLRIEYGNSGGPVDVFLLSTKFHKAQVHGEHGVNTVRMVECIVGEAVVFLVVSDPYNPLCEFPRFNGVFCHLNEDE